MPFDPKVSIKTFSIKSFELNLQYICTFSTIWFFIILFNDTNSDFPTLNKLEGGKSPSLWQLSSYIATQSALLSSLAFLELPDFAQTPENDAFNNELFLISFEFRRPYQIRKMSVSNLFVLFSSCRIFTLSTQQQSMISHGSHFEARWLIFEFGGVSYFRKF